MEPHPHHGRTQPSGKGGGRNFMQGDLTSRKIMDSMSGGGGGGGGGGVLSAFSQFNERGGGGRCCPLKLVTSF